MIIGLPKEIKLQEYRVALIPAGCGMLVQPQALTALQHHVGDENIKPRSRQPDAGVDTIVADLHIVTELGENACDELTNSPIRLRQENTRHWLP